MADLLTICENFGLERLSELKVTWIGDGNNMANSWINAASVLGFKLAIACPEGYDPDPTLLSVAKRVALKLMCTATQRMRSRALQW